MKPGLLLELKENLKRLKLSGMSPNLEEHLRQAKEEGLSYEEFLCHLTEEEIQIRQENKKARRLREAKFPLIKPLESFDLDCSKGLDKRKIRELSECDFIKEKRNIIFLGKSGTGKTHLATALGIEACKKDFRVKFITGYGLANELIEGRSNLEVSKILQRYSKYDLLILDELGYVPFSKEGGELLFQALAERYERGAIIITTNLGFGNWNQIFGEKILTAALLDRLTHKAHILNCDWESYRLKESLKKKEKLKKTR